jgi:hypothetical protein
MSRGLERTLAVAIADLRSRLRRPASAWLLAGLALAAYFTIPPPSSSTVLFVIEGARARYTSEALAFATATLLPIFLGLFGFYVVGRAVGHDAATRVGPLVAATPVRRVEYVCGKLVGSTAILGAVTAGFLVCVMGMHLVRAEGPLLPQVYVSYYLVIGLPCILGVAAFALFFESVPGLGGRVGDVLYFFTWVLMVPLALEPWNGRPTAEPGLGRYFDWSGLGFAVAEVVRLTGASDFSIGATSAALTKPPVDFPALSVGPATLAWRTESLLLPALLVLGAIALFHRFDPARVRRGASTPRRGPLSAAGALIRPLSRALLGAFDRMFPASIGSHAVRRLAAEVLLTARLNPLFPTAVVVALVLAVALPLPVLRGGALPVLTALLVPLLADPPVRERQAGMSGIVYAAPGFERRLVLLKLGTTASVAQLVVGAPALRLLLEQPATGVSLVLGALVFAAGSVLLGVATSSPKPFMALALAFWYVALSAGHGAPALDFAGFSGTATAAARLGYVAAVLLLAMAALTLESVLRRFAD